jgi:predicted ribosomally synthesized peptide with SipW-like signal peptide
MSLRKIAGLLVAFGLVVGLIGGGVGAAFSDQVTATEDIHVGSFGCIISATTAGTIAPDFKSVTYSAPDITSSAAGSAPLTFTVKSTGSIPVTLKLTQTTPPAPFTSILAASADVNLTQNGTHDYAAGLQWSALTNANLGTGVGIVYTVNCVEQSAAPILPANTYVFKSTNDANRAGTTPGHTGQHPYVDAVPASGAVALTFVNPDVPQWACFEWRTDGDVPEQRLVADENSVGPPFAANYLPGLNDGLYKYACPGQSGYGTPGATNPNPTTITLTGIHYVEVRLSFGGESDYRFDWTRFNALP